MKKINRIIIISFLIICLSASISTCEEKALKRWTFMVYLNADNNLDSFGLKDLKEMAGVGSDAFINIVVLIDREHSGAKTLFIKKRKEIVLEEHGEIDMGDYSTLAQFGNYCVSNFPAEHYALVVWNHGSGWNKNNKGPLRGISYDDQSGNHISTPQLGQALGYISEKIGRPIDIFGMDACLMQMMEVVFEIRNHVDYVVASEETEPGNGWPYKSVLKIIGKNPQISPRAFSAGIVTAYRNSYLAGSLLYSTTQSSIDTGKIDFVAEKLNNLSLILLDKMKDYEFRVKFKQRVLPSLQRFYVKDNVDLVDLCKKLRSNFYDHEIDRASLELLKALTDKSKGAIVISRTTGKETKNADGLAIYLPSGYVSSAYGELAFARYNWYEFIKRIRN